VTAIQFAVLQALWQRRGATATELSDYLVIDSATITGVIDRLSKTGALERRPDPSDRRAYRLYLTASGKL
jgi:DNA-binding MarR family transcriptional regulator